MSHFYPLKYYIPEAFKNRIISSAENGGGTEAVEQLRTAPLVLRVDAKICPKVKQ